MANLRGTLTFALGLVALLAVPLLVLWVTQFGIGATLAVVPPALLLFVAVPGWTYLDARGRGLETGRAAWWSALTFLLPLVGLLAYLLARRR